MKTYLTLFLSLSLSGFTLGEDAPTAAPVTRATVKPVPTAKPVAGEYRVTRHILKAEPAVLTVVEMPGSAEFEANLATRWKPATDVFLVSILKQIRTARKEGDADAYAKLTATYTAWAEKYLVR